jgi:hypothetical protein
LAAAHGQNPLRISGEFDKTALDGSVSNALARPKSSTLTFQSVNGRDVRMITPIEGALDAKFD